MAAMLLRAGLCSCLLIGGGSAASVVSRDIAPAVAVGDAVAIHGLVSSEGRRHNGSRGVVTELLASGRFTVQLDGGGLLKVKPDNLQAAPHAVAGAGSSLGADNASVALLLPDTTSHTRLVLQPEGVQWLEALRGPVVLVSVVGAYRTGKSFLLNELMGVGCTQGFTVGHRRETQTKGVWLSTRTRMAITPGGRNVTVVYVDTEGFEGTGQASVYDDRIFAFATLVSSVLVYNLVRAPPRRYSSRAPSLPIPTGRGGQRGGHTPAGLLPSLSVFLWNPPPPLYSNRSRPSRRPTLVGWHSRPSCRKSSSAAPRAVPPLRPETGPGLGTEPGPGTELGPGAEPRPGQGTEAGIGPLT